ncbi:MAG TPA: hypothetical protein VNA31_07685 [bacterium]|nr:hypothetical protein [bacterium]
MRKLHGLIALTDLYRWHDVVRFLDEDAENWWDFWWDRLGRGPRKPL